MISRVRRENQKIAEFLERLISEDLESVLERSPAFQMYAPNWLSSSTTGFMDAEQEGWFLNLLLRAWWDGIPQSTLPATDEAKLKRWAKYKIPDVVSSSAQAQLERDLNYPARWAEVRAEFLPVPQHPELLYNPKLTRILMDSFTFRLERSQSGKRGAEAKAANKGLTSSAQAQDKLSSSSASSQLKLSSSSLSLSLPSSEKDFQKQEKVSGSVWDSDKPQNEDETGEEDEGKSQRRKLFSPTKFQVNEKMLIWFQDKYPEFNGGDVKYLTERFVNVYTGRRAFSFTRAWYNFVDKEIVSIGYRPGQYDWKTSNSRPAGGKTDVNEIADKLRAETEAKIRDHQPAPGNIFSLLDPEDD